jgi:uncharacterized protein (UPF0333 family)
MQKSKHKIHFFSKAKVSSALLFSLALLLLIDSCPLKRLLKNTFSANSTSATKGNQTNINEPTVTNYSNSVNSCAVSEKPVFTIDLSQQVNLHTPVYFQNIINEPGYNTHYFLSRINYSYNPSSASFNSSLPLFLQHLRLLI